MCFKEALQCSGSNRLYAVVTIGNTHQDTGVRGSIPLPIQMRIAQWIEHGKKAQVRFLFSPMWGGSSVVEHYAFNVAIGSKPLP